MFPCWRTRGKIDFIIFSGHGDPPSFGMQYMNDEKDLRLVKFTELAKVFLPLVNKGVILSTCHSMEIPSMYDSISYTGSNFLAGYNGSVPWVESLIWEMKFLLDIILIGELPNGKYGPNARKGIRAIKFPGK